MPVVCGGEAVAVGVAVAVPVPERTTPHSQNLRADLTYDKRVSGSTTACCPYSCDLTGVPFFDVWKSGRSTPDI
jgi:hypothetical protein